MPLETLQSPVRQPARAAPPPLPSRPRLRPKGPVGPDFYRQFPSAAGRPKQSAVERLEADKVKYVKSQVALSKQQPVRAPEGQRPGLSPSAALRPTRKTQTPSKPPRPGVQLDLERLTHLISNVPEESQSSAAAVGSEGSGVDRTAPSDGGSTDPTPGVVEQQQKKERPCPPPRADWSTPAKVRLKASGPARVEVPGSPGAPAAGTVRRVDVMPGTGPVRLPCRPSLYLRQPLQPLPTLPPHFPLRQANSNLRLFHTRTTPGVSPLKPVMAPSKPPDASSSPETPGPSPPAPALPLFPPPSPAVTRRSSSSSRKRPSLTRSKSDMSDRCSRAGTELERFFNLCGLDPADLQEWTGSSSDIVSMARFRSVSAPGSEVAGSNREQEEEEEEEEEEAAGKGPSRVPYGVSVIERNARVIKWLYGLRHAKDSASQSTNL